MTTDLAAQTEAAANHIRRISLGDILRRSARRYGDKIALIDGEATLSYRQMDAAANRFAHHLLGLGLKAPARVGMLCANSIDMLVANFGIFKAGLTWVPINHTLAADPIGYIFDHAEIKTVVLDRALYERPDIRELLDSRGIHPIIATTPTEEPIAGLSSVREIVASGPTTEPDVEISSDQLAYIMYTSGTTGRQKGVMHSHASAYVGIASNLFETGLRPGQDVHSCILPLFHVGQWSVTAPSLHAGCTTVLQRGFDPAQTLANIQRHKMTILVGLPMMYGAMLTHPDKAKTDLSSLRLCLYAMAPMSKTMLLTLMNEFCPNFALASGQTEVFPAASMFETHEQLKRFGAYWGVGTSVCEMTIMGEDGRLLGPGEVGEIVFRGPNVMLGYYKDPEATAQVQRFGWHHTGDLGVLDEDGQLLFLDRLKDMIKSGGENVPSIKVEEVLLRHPAVMNAAVVGLPHDRWGEAITAFITVRPEKETSADELIAHCKQHLGGFEVPKAVMFLDAFPMTSTGKVQKFELRKAHLEHFQQA